MRTRKIHKRIYRIWIVISILAILAMLAFTIAPFLTYGLK
mgnify:CR=1 FL=1